MKISRKTAAIVLPAAALSALLTGCLLWFFGGKGLVPSCVSGSEITLVTEIGAGGELYLSADTDELMIDWGDGNAVRCVRKDYTVTHEVWPFEETFNGFRGVVKGSTVKIYSDGAVTAFECREGMLSGLDLSRNEGLDTLECTFTRLTDIDLSHNTGLTRLDLRYNPLPGEADISMLTRLDEYNCDLSKG